MIDDARYRHVDKYSSEWEDLAGLTMPKTLKQLFALLSVVFHTSSDLAALIYTKIGYVTTDLVYRSPSAKGVVGSVIPMWKDVLENKLDINAVERTMLIDYEIFGNSFVFFLFPWRRIFTCKACHSDIQDAKIEKGSLSFSGSTFSIKCPYCGSVGTAEFRDHIELGQPSRIRLRRLAPEDIRISYNDISGEREYRYRPSRILKNKLASSDNTFIAMSTPEAFLRAAIEDKVVLLNSSLLYHLTSGIVAQRDASWGFPPMAHILRDAWLSQLGKKAQESIIHDHALPLTILSPAQGAASAAPSMNIELATWRNQMEQTLRTFRRDKNLIALAPIPVNIENIRGDSNALSVTDDLAMLRQSMFAAYGIPAEMVYGNVNWTGASVSLRIAENQLLALLSHLNRFLTSFVVPKLIHFCGLPPIRVEHQTFKMADDVQQKSHWLSLYNSKVVSAKTLCAELGIDYDAEKDQIRAEVTDAIVLQRMLALSEAENQADAQSVMAERQVDMQYAMQEREEQHVRKQIQEVAEESGMTIAEAEAALAQQQQQQQQQQQAATVAKTGAAPTTARAAEFQSLRVPMSNEFRASLYMKVHSPADIVAMLPRLSKTDPEFATTLGNRLSMLQEVAKRTGELSPVQKQRPGWSGFKHGPRTPE